MSVAQTGVEQMTAEEIEQLDVGRQIFALSEIVVALSQCGRDAIDARQRLTQVRLAWLRKDIPDRASYESMLDVAKADFDSLKLRSTTLRDIKSTFQTIMRVTH